MLQCIIHRRTRQCDCGAILCAATAQHPRGVGQQYPGIVIQIGKLVPLRPQAMQHMGQEQDIGIGRRHQAAMPVAPGNIVTHHGDGHLQDKAVVKLRNVDGIRMAVIGYDNVADPCGAAAVAMQHGHRPAMEQVEQKMPFFAIGRDPADLRPLAARPRQPDPAQRPARQLGLDTFGGMGGHAGEGFGDNLAPETLATRRRHQPGGKALNRAQRTHSARS